MSLNDFSPYVQFLAAFYLSLAFEGLIDRFFFTPLFEKRVEELYKLVSNQFGLDDAGEGIFRSKMDSRRQEVMRYTKYISGVSFVSCLMLLLLAAIEISVPAISFSWEKNSWLGYWWITVIVLITLPAVYCVIYTMHYCYYRVPGIKRMLNQQNEKMAQYIRCYVSTRPDKCSDFFKNEILKQVATGASLNAAEILTKAKDSYSRKCFEDLMAKV